MRISTNLVLATIQFQGSTFEPLGGGKLGVREIETLQWGKIAL